MTEKELIEFRRELHKYPELSGREAKTAEKIIDKLKSTGPDKIISGLGGYGVAAVYECGKGGKTVMLRADLDALPIPEANDFEYKSTNPGVAHKCGHDGHMTILTGLGYRIGELKKKLNGRIVLLFQPAEETAQGARAVLEDDKFTGIRPDYAFALHNIPGYPKGSIVYRNGVYSSASRGLIVRLKGDTSHAAHPENSRSPVLAMTSLIHELIAIPQYHTAFSNAALVTVIHAKLGERAFGTTPGYAEVMATFRSHSDKDMDKMVDTAEKYAENISIAHNLEHEIEWVEVFPSTGGTDEMNALVIKAAENAGLEIIEKIVPLPASEDFGFFLNEFDGSFFGLGSGEDQWQLHNSAYDFPDEIIMPGIEIYEEILKILLK